MLKKNNISHYMRLQSYEAFAGSCLMEHESTASENHLILCSAGECHITIGRKHHHCHSRSLMYLHRFVNYQLEIPKDTKAMIYRLHFVSSTDPEYLDLDALCQANPVLNNFMHNSNRFCLLYDQANICLLIQEMLQESDIHSVESTTILTAYMTILYTKMARNFHTRSKASGINYVSQAKKYLAEHSREQIRIQNIADEIGISRSHLENLFSKYAGRRITTHLNVVRVDQAAKLLAESDKGILDIALEVGFTNRQHFTREFKKRFGLSPGQYRKIYLCQAER